MGRIDKKMSDAHLNYAPCTDRIKRPKSMVMPGIRITVLCACLLVFFPGFSSVAVSAEPMKVIQTTVNGILEFLKDKELSKEENSRKRKEQILQLISENFNFKEMSRRSLALHWRKRNPEEKKEFIALFKHLLERRYMEKIEAYSDEKVVYSDELIDNNYSVVKTKIVTDKNLEIPINYRLKKIDSKWNIYDVVIEGVSLVNNYRSQFNKIIRSRSYEVLVKKMKSKQEQE